MSQLRASLALPIRAESQSSVSPEQLLREIYRPQKRGCVKGMAYFSRVLVPLVDGEKKESHRSSWCCEPRNTKSKLTDHFPSHHKPMKIGACSELWVRPVARDQHHALMT